MRALPVIDGREVYGALIVRTDYGDEAAWRAVMAKLAQPWGPDGEYEAVAHVMDDPVWADATPDEVAASADDRLGAVFLADGTTMREPDHALLAVELRFGKPWGGKEGPNEWVALGRRFRTEPRMVHTIHANLSIANMDFEEYAAAAGADPEGVLRPFRSSSRPGT
ncbi:hypothetical protein OG948_40000 (plasmid) [Embleya sp. NBC_00888]|uniref:DUF6924 domain-containing protein n=1 Tax=Embleya sp. NBC_00888 TaxID=2975960 RepID=UPI002F90B1DA|nr:hypothetical protein OG948_40000 [Embleya sp. NBC_00888]